MKIKLFLFLLGLFALVSVRQVAAQSNDTNVINSGDDAHITSNTTQTNNVDIDNNNDADIDQKVVAVANTGGNVASRNISFNGGTSITTGDASTDVNMDVKANQNVTAVNMDNNNCCGGNETEVVNTGDDLRVDTRSTTNNHVDVDNDNDADVDQNVVAVSNTGLNFANRNIGDTSITTGDADVDVDLRANVNRNFTAVEMGSMGASSNQTFVTNTGDDVRVDTRADVNNRVDVDNNNDADIDQNVKAIANTGLNFAKRNISSCEEGDNNCEEEHAQEDQGVVEINTGAARVDTDMRVNANRNETFVSMAENNQCCENEINRECNFGRCGEEETFNNGEECCGGNRNEVVNTGDDFRLESRSNVENNIDVDNDNDLDVDQRAFEFANSGLNFASRNIGDTEIFTGEARTGANLAVTGNINRTFIGNFEEGFFDFDEDFFNNFFMLE